GGRGGGGDEGCGVGFLVGLRRRRGFRAGAAAAGRDPPAALAGCSGIQYVHFDFERYELRGLAGAAPYTVILRHVLEHVRDPYSCLTSLRRQGARQLYIVVPNVSSLERRLLGPCLYLWDPPRHLWHFDRLSLGRPCDPV